MRGGIAPIRALVQLLVSVVIVSWAEKSIVCGFKGVALLRLLFAISNLRYPGNPESRFQKYQVFRFGE